MTDLLPDLPTQVRIDGLPRRRQPACAGACRNRPRTSGPKWCKSGAVDSEMFAWLLTTLAVACLAVAAGYWRPWAASAVMSLAGVLALVRAWRRMPR